MECPSCGNTVRHGSQFCPSCGSRTATPASVSAASGHSKTLPRLPSAGPYVAVSPAEGAARELLTNHRALIGAAGAAVVVIVVLALTVLSRAESDGDAEASANVIPSSTGRTLPPATTASASAENGASSGPGIPDFREHRGRYFTVDVPADWDPTAVDNAFEIAEGASISRWEIPFESLLQIQTSAPLTGTIAQDCSTIFADRQRGGTASASAPEMSDVGDRDVCEFSYVRADGQYRKEYLFAIGDREFSIAAGGGNSTLVDQVALQAVSTLQLR